MDTSLSVILISILASSVGFVVSTLTNWYIGLSKDKLAYKNEYYKKLIEKRFNAYQTIESVLQRMQNTIRWDEGKYEYYAFFDDENSYNQFLDSVISSPIAAWWLSREMVEITSSFKQFIWNELLFMPKDERRVKLGIMHHQKLKEYYSNIEHILFNDLKNLHDVEHFIENTKNISK
jgi:hypothetical protein